MPDFAPHDHDACVASALSAAEATCAERGLRLTEGRRRVLEILLEAHRALGAYEVLDRLRDEGRPAQPPVAYRALDFLMAQGFVHRIERLNAFVACARPGVDHAAAFLICRSCAAVAETPVSPGGGRLGNAARASGFALEAMTMEAEGLCPSCREGAS